MISFTSVFPPYRGGISNFSDYLFTHLSNHDEVTPINFRVLYPDLLFPGATQFQDNPKEVYAERLLHSYNPFNWRSTGNSIGQTKPDTLLFSYWHPFFIPAFNQIIKRVRKWSPDTKVCTVAHNVSPHEGFPFSAQLMRAFFSNNDLVVTLSNQTQQEFEKLDTGANSLKLFHPVYTRPLPDVPRKELKSKYSIQPDENVVLFFGLIRDYKGLDILIKALNKIDLEKLKIRPLIVGEFYSSKEKYLNLINIEHRNNYKVIDRFVTPEEANEIFTISDVLVLPYKSASQSGVFNDALNFNLPAIVSDMPGLVEHIEHKKTGLIFESENTDALCNMITEIIINKELKEHISSQLAKLKMELSWDKFSAELVQHL